jgi:hypothetical protein
MRAIIEPAGSSCASFCHAAAAHEEAEAAAEQSASALEWEESLMPAVAPTACTLERLGDAEWKEMGESPFASLGEFGSAHVLTFVLIFRDSAGKPTRLRTNTYPRILVNGRQHCSLNFSDDRNRCRVDVVAHGNEQGECTISVELDSQHVTGSPMRFWTRRYQLDPHSGLPLSKPSIGMVEAELSGQLAVCEGRYHSMRLDELFETRNSSLSLQQAMDKTDLIRLLRFHREILRKAFRYYLLRGK